MFARGATAYLSAGLRIGTSKVNVTINKNGEPYTGRTVYLSTSSTTNTQSYRLTYSASTQTYTHNAVADGTYYVWANGRHYKGTYTTECVTSEDNPIVVSSIKDPIKWLAIPYNASTKLHYNGVQGENHHIGKQHDFVVYTTTNEYIFATPGRTPVATIDYYKLTVNLDDEGITYANGEGVYFVKSVVCNDGITFNQYIPRTEIKYIMLNLIVHTYLYYYRNNSHIIYILIVI